MNSRLKALVDSLVNYNTNDQIYISKDFLNDNKIIENIINHYELNDNVQKRLWFFIKSLLKLHNVNLVKINNKLLNDVEVEALLFENIKKIKDNKLDYFINIFINFFTYKVKENDLYDYIYIIINIDIDNLNYLHIHNYEEKYLVENKYGEALEKYKFAKKLNFQIRDCGYYLVGKCLDFLKNIYFDITSKEVDYYCSSINYEKMSSLMSITEHKIYYRKVYEQIGINNNSVKVARLKKGKFKDFFEEYSTLISFAYSLYGNNCQIRWCGKEIDQKLHYDGIILHDNKEYKIEISNPFYSSDSYKKVSELNRKGITIVKCDYVNNGIKKIYEIIEKKLIDKNKNEYYDNSISLVIMMDDYQLLFSNFIENTNMFEELFEPLKRKEYKFKKVYILLEKYYSFDKKIEPRIICIK